METLIGGFIFYRGRSKRTGQTDERAPSVSVEDGSCREGMSNEGPGSPMEAAGDPSVDSRRGPSFYGLHIFGHYIRTEDAIMTLWLFFNIISGIWTVAFGMPASVYLGELITTALPMIFYYAGRRTGDRNAFYRNFIAAVVFVGILGVVLYITAPDFYLDYLFRLEYISKADAATMRVRMLSVIGSTLMGYLAAAAMLASFHFIIRSGGKKGKLLFLVNCFLAFMSNQRSAMTVAILIVIYVNILVFFTFHMLPKRIFKVECIAVAIGFVAFVTAFHGAFMKIYYRLVSLPGAVGQRSDQWVGAANNMADKWLGNGLGANGHRAAEYTKHMIADGGLAKLYCEMGIVGTALFAFLMILVVRKGLGHLKACAPELGIVVMTLLVSIGSNVMSFALSVPIFYYAVGAIVHETGFGSRPHDLERDGGQP
ncbi:MAG: hypothetical protein K5989_10860 [Lachnospiraceae bacterium]|nr:hypothetical protein [Lachnospiraceae bacterium]